MQFRAAYTDFKPLFEKLSELLPEMIASRQAWSVTLRGKGAGIDLEITRHDSVIVRPPEATRELVLSR